MFFSVFCFFCFFFRLSKNTRQPFSGMAERIFMKLLLNDSGKNVVSNVVPKWGLGAQIFFFGGGLKLHIVHLVVTPGEWLKISLMAMALCSYGGCVKKPWARECIFYIIWKLNSRWQYSIIFLATVLIRSTFLFLCVYSLPILLVFIMIIDYDE